MSGRRWAGLGLGMLLTLPVVGLLWVGMASPEASGWRRLPMLPPDARLALPTFVHPCETSADCEAPLACVYESSRRARVCVGSDCTTDSDCLPSMVCRWIPVEEPGAKVALSYCTFTGFLPEGAPCVRLGEREDNGCERDFVCADWCARRCGSWLTGDCPEGYFCAPEGPNGPVCLPTCEGRACPEGEACVRMEGGVSVCSRVHGRDCQREPCAAGLDCQVLTRPFRPGEAWMWCAAPCRGEGSFSQGCPPYQSCMDGTCWEGCSPMESEPCAADAVCVPTGGEYGVCVLSPGGLDAGT